MSEHGANSPSSRLLSADTWHRWQMNDLEREDAEHRATRGSRNDRERDQAREAQVERERGALEATREQARQEGFEAGRAEGYEAGRQEGYEAGLKEANAVAELEFQKRLDLSLTPIAGLAEAFQQALAALDDQVGNQLVELALITGRKLAGESLMANPDHVLSVVRELLDADTSLTGRPRLWLHPEDLALVESTLGDALVKAGWECQEDASLERGGCRATSAAGGLDASLSTQWQAILDQRRARRKSQATPPESDGDV
ncbi:flagellar assembly protein FliH [Salinicola aestuarinus]|uniref:flagellar assembly protein FliH n=1 Tax=Salinicola aestuarinus TaxID=1949082 RepID=UPI000DA1D261|nr:flagellar assembly protein FliH [Salinicola aestuarinus]